MKNVSVQGNTGVSEGNPLPLCHWSFNRAHEFHHVSGDAVPLFGRRAADLRRRHVSIIDDPSGTWSARLDRMFQRESPVEQSAAPGPEGEYALFHVPVHADHGAAIYVAGFAFPAGSSLPCATQIEWAANAVLQALDLERTRATRFLHDVVAQSLSGTGFQLELLKSEIHAQGVEPLKRILEIQRSLDEVLKLIREFSAPE